MIPTIDDRTAALARVADEERKISRTIMNRIFRAVGPTRPFIAFYRAFGPAIDRTLQRVTGGSVFARVYGFQVLVLATEGAKTGTRRLSPLMYVRDGEDFVVVGTNFGTANHPGWTANLAKNPNAQIEVFGASFDVVGSRVADADFERLWPRFVAVYQGYDDYKSRIVNRDVRMFRLEPRTGRVL